MSKQLNGSKPASLPWRAEEAYAAEIELERARWKAITAFVELLSEDERLVPGYYRDPDWSVKDLIAHLEAEVDVEALNAATLAGVKAEPWDRVWAQTTGARAWMVEAWFGLRGPDEAANQWIRKAGAELRKAGAEHYGEHLSRLRDWVAEVIDLRNRPVVDEWEG